MSDKITLEYKRVNELITMHNYGHVFDNEMDKDTVKSAFSSVIGFLNKYL